MYVICVRRTDRTWLGLAVLPDKQSVQHVSTRGYRVRRHALQAAEESARMPGLHCAPRAAARASFMPHVTDPFSSDGSPMRPAPTW